MGRTKEWIRLKEIWAVVADLEKCCVKLGRLSHGKFLDLELKNVIDELVVEANELKEELDEGFELK